MPTLKHVPLRLSGLLVTTPEQALDLDFEQQDRAVHAFHTADINGDGELDLAEFKQVLGTLGMSIPKKQFEAYADAFFTDLDIDGSRTLDLEVRLFNLNIRHFHMDLEYVNVICSTCSFKRWQAGI